jgi:hypothetical protein
MEWLIYLLKVSVCTGLFYAFYHFFLRKLTFFNSNRFYLITTLILSLAIPALQFDVEVSGAETTPALSSPNYVDGATGLTIPRESYLMINDKENVSKEIDWDSVSFTVYGTVSILILINFLFQVIRLLFYTRNVVERIGRLRIVFKPLGFTNCSFFNYVFVDQTDLLGRDMQVFLQHESVHAAEYHSVDKIITALSKVLLWFNPFVYLYERELSQLHEYEADKFTCQIIGNQSYATLLLEKGAKEKTHSFVHPFALKPLKGRILMLFSSQSKNMKKFRYLAALPLIATLLLGFSVEYVPATIADNETVHDSTVFRQRIKRTPAMINSKKAFEEWRKTDDYKRKSLIMKEIGRRTLTGIVKYSAEPVDRIHGNSVLFVSDNTTYLLMLGGGPESIRDILKDNSTVTVTVNFAVITQLSKYVEVRAASVIVDGKEVYSTKPSIAPPFLYEVNKVRFADGIIKQINSTGSGKKELQISANGYTFLLKVDDTQVSLSELDELKAGDNLRFRFIHEIRTGAKAYTIRDWVSLSKNIKSYGIKNKLIFAKFYEQVVLTDQISLKRNFKQVSYTQNFEDKLSFTAKDSSVVDEYLTKLFGGATLTFNEFNIKADQIVFNRNTLIGVAKLASFHNTRLHTIVEETDSVQFDFRAKKFKHFGFK